MTTLEQICEYLEMFAPSALAEDWDNVGLLVGDRAAPVAAVMTCLTITPASAQEAIAANADLIVTHHPLPFRPLKRVTTDSTPGRLLWELIGAGIAVYSPHTAFDSARAGINQLLAAGIGLKEIEPLAPSVDDPSLGAGRVGRFAQPQTLDEAAAALKQFLSIQRLQRVQFREKAISKVAVACGSAGQFLGAAAGAGCDLLITGETSFHTCLEAEAIEVALLLTGHYSSERFAVEQLAAELAAQFTGLNIWASRDEADPLDWI